MLSASLNRASCGVAGSAVCSDLRTNGRCRNSATCSSRRPTLDSILASISLSSSGSSGRPKPSMDFFEVHRLRVDIGFVVFGVGSHHEVLAPQRNREHSIEYQAVALNVGLVERLHWNLSASLLRPPLILRLIASSSSRSSTKLCGRLCSPLLQLEQPRIVQQSFVTEKCLATA